MISSEEISVIVQGAITPYTTECLKSIRQILPKSEIILSTWEGSNISNLDYNIIALNKDPGAEILNKQTGQLHNLNRQIVSTYQGLKRASRKYALKTRTDILFYHNHFLRMMEKFPCRNEKLKFLEKRILVCQHYTRKAEFLPFHVSDWVMFGLLSDLLKIWNIPLAPEPETTMWFYNHPLTSLHIDEPMFFHFRHRYCAEQYIWSSFLRKFMHLNFEHMFDLTFENIYYTKLSFANNAIILNENEYGIKFLKCSLVNEKTNYTFSDWEILYKNFCDPNYQLNSIEAIKERIPEKYLKKLKNHYSYIIFFISRFLIWIRSFYSVLYYILKIITFLFINVFKHNRNSYQITQKEKKLFNKIIRKLPTSQIKNIYILNCASGETFYIASFYINYLKQHNIKNSILVTTSRSTQAIFSLVSDYPIHYIDSKKIFFKESLYFYNDKKINILFGDNFWFAFWKTSMHFTNAACQYLDFPKQKIPTLKLSFNYEKKQILENICKQKGLDINKFVFIAPEAQSIDPICEKFWINLLHKLQKYGYDIIVNSATPPFQTLSVKYALFNFEQTIILASYAKAIVGLRSGLLEMLLLCKTPIHAIYNLTTNNKNPYLKFAYSNYSLLQYPLQNPKNIYEYFYKKDNAEKIINKIFLSIEEDLV